MATSKTNDSCCVTCGKAKGTFTCRGCSKDFCLRHTNEHRQELAKQMDEDIIPLHDQLRQMLDEQITKSDAHPLMKQIHDWEQYSIDKIHQTANDARQQILNVINTNNDKIKESLEPITQQLKTARNDDHFFEDDLKEWITKLDKLQNDFLTPQTINIHYDNNPTAFVSKLLIDTTGNISECFEQCIGNILIKNNGTVATHNQRNHCASVRGKGEYSLGEHHFRFTIENLDINNWVFIGIASKSALTPASPSIGKACYGFSGGDNVWRNGAFTKGLNGYKSDFRPNDIIELFINCDQRQICLFNERTKSTHTLNVDTSDCPFPWKLSVGFYYSAGESIRILL